MTARLALFAGLSSVVAWAVTDLATPPDVSAPQRPVTDFPVSFDDWLGRDRGLSDRQYRILETREVLFRRYEHAEDDAAVDLCVAVAGGNRKVAHPPAMCYRGQGWEIVADQSRAVTLGGRSRELTELTIRKGDRVQLVWSWYRVGDVETASYLHQQWLGVVAEWADRPSVSALVRFSVPLSDVRQAAAGRMQLERFAQDALPRLDRAFARRGDAP